MKVEEMLGLLRFSLDRLTPEQHEQLAAEISTLPPDIKDGEVPERIILLLSRFLHPEVYVGSSN